MVHLRKLIADLNVYMILKHIIHGGLIESAARIIIYVVSLPRKGAAGGGAQALCNDANR